MKIPEDVRIKKVTYKGDHKIFFEFTDGHATEIDFYPFLSAAGQNPMNSQYLDVLRFKEYQLHKDVDIYWDDWEMCFRFETLYNGKLPKMPRPLSRRTIKGKAHQASKPL